MAHLLDTPGPLTFPFAYLSSPSASQPVISRCLLIPVVLGAQRVDVLATIMREGLKLVVIGVSLGVPIAWPMTGLRQRLLFAVRPTDPLSQVPRVPEPVSQAQI